MLITCQHESNVMQAIRSARQHESKIMQAIRSACQHEINIMQAIRITCQHENKIMQAIRITCQHENIQMQYMSGFIVSMNIFCKQLSVYGLHFTKIKTKKHYVTNEFTPGM